MGSRVKYRMTVKYVMAASPHGMPPLWDAVPLGACTRLPFLLKFLLRLKAGSGKLFKQQQTGDCELFRQDKQDSQKKNISS